ncbi:imidazole glycerol phosphate synthase subunit HisH [Candidatus Venteria ishoeyi]|uniref:imidazole glycerol phosphate synthase subunit HisH n=1 Tax=Candidatus Venteria ishoeyi TaxID=1899563 RepID=UPI0025A51F54|nr:imidazole glycerol phosphate synthase subunit HisH [Candidatus Venteria ishoeyi]MDM8548075.1 imidazole glycerol phosphate synthase subunit HisH [Candidatus Venteria ishoeyi]
MKTLAVIDYGMSNLHSVSRACEHVAGKNWKVQISSEADAVMAADKVVFPGQGAIGNCMHLLKTTGLDEGIRLSLESKPFFGICLGLQTLLTDSEESGGTAGFDYLAGTVRHFKRDLEDPNTGEHLKIPHMGWNQVRHNNHDHPLWQDIPDNSRFYFVHSYYASLENSEFVAATTPYPQGFTSAIAKDNVFAVQFHPEKSQHVGLKLLENFLDW